MTQMPLTFLVVEDDDVDYWAAERALSSLQLTNPVVRAHDGVEALDILRGEEGHTALTEPLMILLDLNMPRMGGLEFLDHLKADPALSHLDVIIVTTSTLQDDLIKAHKQDVRGYVVKYDLIDGLKEVLDEMSLPKALIAA